jgi:hypothetical protein
MFTKTKIALSVVMILGTAVTASAAMKHRVVHVRRSAIYNVSPDRASGDQSVPSGAPLRTTPDGW